MTQVNASIESNHRLVFRVCYDRSSIDNGWNATINRVDWLSDARATGVVSSIQAVWLACPKIEDHVEYLVFVPVPFPQEPVGEINLSFVGNWYAKRAYSKAHPEFMASHQDAVPVYSDLPFAEASSGPDA